MLKKASVSWVVLSIIVITVLATGILALFGILRGPVISPRFSLSPDDNQLLFSASKGGYSSIYAMDIRKGKFRSLTNGKRVDLFPKFSPDGTEILFSSGEEFRQGPHKGLHIYLMKSNGTRRKQLTNGHYLDIYPCFSNSGKFIVFIRASTLGVDAWGGQRWRDYNVYVMNRDGTGLRRLTKRNFYEASCPSFLDSDTKILFAASGDIGASDQLANGIFLLDLRTGLLTQIRSGNAIQQPFVGRDGKQVLFIQIVGSNQGPYDYGIFVLDLKSDSVRELPDLQRKRNTLYNPIFTSNGEKVIFTYQRTIWPIYKRNVIASVQPDGSGLKVLGTFSGIR